MSLFDTTAVRALPEITTLPDTFGEVRSVSFEPDHEDVAWRTLASGIRMDGLDASSALGLHRTEIDGRLGLSVYWPPTV